MTHTLGNTHGDLQMTTNTLRVDPVAKWTAGAAGEPQPTVFAIGPESLTRRHSTDVAQSLGVHCRHLASPNAFFNMALNNRPACVITSDLDFPSLARSNQLPLPVVITSRELDVSQVLRLLQNDAVTVLEAPYRLSDLVEAIERSLRVDARQWQVANRLRSLKERAALLTHREREVLVRVMNGRLNKSIARELDVTQRTIENIRARIMAKFETASVVELARHFTELQLLEEVTSWPHPASLTAEPPPPASS